MSLYERTQVMKFSRYTRMLLLVNDDGKACIIVKAYTAGGAIRGPRRPDGPCLAVLQLRAMMTVLMNRWLQKNEPNHVGTRRVHDTDVLSQF